MDKEELKNWEASIVDGLKYLANLEYQKQSWMGLIPGVADSSNETINTLYDRDFEGYVAYIEDSGSALADKLKELDTMIIEYCKVDLPDDEILKDPNWHLITVKAYEVARLMSS